MEVFSPAGVFSGTPRWSPDGERLAFDSNAAGNMDIYAIRASGGKPVQLTAVFSGRPDPQTGGQGVGGGSTSLRSAVAAKKFRKAPASTGEAVQVTRNGGWVAFESRDGKFLYYIKTDEAHGGLWKMPVSGGVENLVIPSIAEQISRLPRMVSIRLKLPAESDPFIFRPSPPAR